MQFVRTPDARFAKLDGYAFEPNYRSVLMPWSYAQH